MFNRLRETHLSEEQIPQPVEKPYASTEHMDLLELPSLLRRQMLYPD